MVFFLFRRVFHISSLYSFLEIGCGTAAVYKLNLLKDNFVEAFAVSLTRAMVLFGSSG
jgi:hypothetical protein